MILKIWKHYKMRSVNEKQSLSMKILSFLFSLMLLIDLKKRIVPVILINETPIAFIGSCFKNNEEINDVKEKSNFSAGLSFNNNSVKPSKLDKSTKGEITLGVFFRRDVIVNENKTVYQDPCENYMSPRQMEPVSTRQSKHESPYGIKSPRQMDRIPSQTGSPKPNFNENVQRSQISRNISGKSEFNYQ